MLPLKTLNFLFVMRKQVDAFGAAELVLVLLLKQGKYRSGWNWIFHTAIYLVVYLLSRTNEFFLNLSPECRERKQQVVFGSINSFHLWSFVAFPGRRCQRLQTTKSDHLCGETTVQRPFTPRMEGAIQDKRVESLQGIRRVRGGRSRMVVYQGQTPRVGPSVTSDTPFPK